MKYLSALIAGSSMKQKIMTFTIGSVVLSAFILIMTMSTLSQNAIIAQIDANLHSVSSAKATDISDSFIQFTNNMRDLTNSKFIQDALVSYESVAFGTGLDLDEDADISANSYFKNINAKYNENFLDYLHSYPLNSFSIVLNSGFTIAQVGGAHLLGKNVRTGNLKAEAVATCVKQAISGTDYYTGMIDEKGLSKSYYCHKIASKYDRDGYKKNAQMGILVAELDWNFLAKLKDFHEGLGEKGELFLVDGNRVITPPRKMGNVTVNEFMPKKMTFDLKYDEQMNLQNHKNFDGEESMVIIRKLKILPNMNWYLVAQLSRNEALQSITSLKKYSFMVTVATIVVVSILTWLVITSIAGAFLQAGRGVSDNTEKVSGASLRFSEIAGTIASGTHQQSAALQETSASMEEVHSMIQETLKLSKQSSKKASMCVDNAYEGVQKMNVLVDSVTSVGKVTSEAFEKVKESNDSLLNVLSLFKEVESKTKVINEIAFQTKLLSFNASVEAARAGEHGKGFAVVAEEIGQLAGVVNRSSSEINGLIDSTAEKIGSLVEESRAAVEESIQRTEKEIQASQRDAQDGLEFFKGLSTIISDINEEVTQVSTASEEQTRGVGQINKAMSQISDANGKNVTMSSELEQQTKVLEDAVLGLTISNKDMNNILMGSKV